jgi:hypothetical protein
MHLSSTARRLLRAAHLVALASILCFPAPAAAADTDVILELRPHCDANDQELENVFGGPIGQDIPGIMTPTDGSHCASYPIVDPLHRTTELKKIGDELDMDLVIVNPQGKPVSRVRGWIAYDPTILEGVSVEMLPAFPVPTPGEADFDAQNGMIKIGASTQGAVSTSVIKVARIKMKVLSTPSNSTILSFDDVSGSVQSHSAVITTGGGQEANLLPSTLGSLIVRLDAPIALSSSSNGAGTANQSSSAAPIQPSSFPLGAGLTSSQGAASSALAPSTTAFTLLQVQNLRATTEGSAVFLAWDPLPSAEITGYNVYYGTVSGRYIQRRSIDSSSTTLTIRGLMAGTTYYFAVRGANAKKQETQFSREVGIRVGSPETSTSPLAAGAITNKGPGGKTPKTGGAIAGESGPSSAYTLFFVICASIGTLFAFRRQFIASL